MAGYVVMEPPAAEIAAGKDAVLVRDGFVWLGFLVPFLWLLWHRLWLEAVIVLALAIGLGILSEVDSFIYVTPLLSLLVSFYVGLEGPALRLARMRRRGWREAGVVEADNRSDAELRYLFDAAQAGESGLETAAVAPVSSSRPQTSSRPSGPALGLLGYSGNPR